MPRKNTSESSPIIEGADGRNETVADYYRETEEDYKKRMELEGHESLHFGYFEPEHRTGVTVLGHEHAAANTNLKERLADLGGVTEGTRVIDAGCGIGETACWLAEQRGATVTGLNITDTQLETARERAKQRGVADQVEFRLDDFTEMETVSDNSADVVWGLESMCYAKKKRDVLAQAKRVLRPGGTIVVADGFMGKRSLSWRERRWMKTYLEGWAVPNFAHHTDFTAELDDLGFMDIDYQDVTGKVLPSSKFLYVWGTLALPLGVAYRILGRISDVQYRNWIAARAQYKALKRRAWVYGIVTAKLPDTDE